MKKIKMKKYVFIFCAVFLTVLLSIGIFAINAETDADMNREIEIQGTEKTVNMTGRNDVLIGAKTISGVDINIGYARYEYSDEQQNTYLFDEENRMLFFIRNTGTIENNTIALNSNMIVSRVEMQEIAESALCEQIINFSEYSLEDCIPNALNSYTFRYRKQIDEGISDFAEVVMDFDGSIYSIFINYANMSQVTDEMENEVTGIINEYLQNYSQSYENVYTDVTYSNMDGSVCVCIGFHFSDETGEWTEIKDYVLSVSAE